MADGPVAEVDIDTALVRRLLRDQFPELLHGRDVRAFTHGWDNVMVRLGDDLLVRLPRRALAAPLILNEARWLTQLAPVLPQPIPVPIGLGEPGHGYPWHWTVVPWIAGRPLGTLPVAERARSAVDLGLFFAVLHRPAPADLWRSPYRGTPLAGRTETLRGRLAETGDLALWPLWERGLAAELTQPGTLWVHGDPHPLNLLARDPLEQEPPGLAGVLDWGDLTQGDPACDLATAWLGLDGDQRRSMRSTYDLARTHDLDLDRLWLRARAWAVPLAWILAYGSADHPAHVDVGRQALAQLGRELDQA